MTLSEKLYNLRRKQGLSQEGLAEKLDCSRQVISKWENGTTTPDAEMLQKYSELFGVSMDYLVKDDIVCSRQFAKIAVFDTSKHKACQGNMHCLSLARHPNLLFRKGETHYEKSESKIRKRCNAYRKSMGALRPTCK